MEEAEQYSGEPEEAALEVATPESDATEPADVAELKKMHADLHRHLTMQVSSGQQSAASCCIAAKESAA